METVKKALPWVQELKAFVTRRASIDEFNRSCRALIRFVNSVLGGGPTHVGLRPKRRLMDHIDVIRFSFRTIHQKVTLRRFPRNYSDMWAYIGLPISEVTSSLSVSQGVISRRRRQYGICWPAHSDTENVLLAVQVFSIGKGRVTRRIHVGASRGTSLLDIHKRLRVKFHVSNTKRTALYVEVKGIRYGPLWKPAQWNEVLTHGENTYKINLLFVVWKTVTSIPVSRYLIYAPGHKEDHGGVPEAPSGSNVAPKTGKPARSSGNPNGVTSQTMNRDIRQESTKQRICNKMDANTPKYFKGRYEEIVKDVYKSGGIGSVPVGRIETGVIKPGKELEKEPEFLKNGDAGMVKLLPTKHMVAETFAEYPVGRFVVRDMRQSVAVRVIKSVDKKDPSGTMVTKAAVKKGAK